MFPAASVTVHVTVVVPTGNEAGASFETDSPGQLSEALADPSETPEAEQAPESTFTVTSEGQEIVGSMLSITVTV